MRKACLSLCGFAVILALVIAVWAADTQKPYTPYVASASKEAEQALKSFQLAPGLTARLWAAEPLLANPVSFCFDEKGRCYVAETFRLHKGVTDDRDNMGWLDDDLANRTVADRVAMYRKHHGSKFASYETEHDRVRLVEDTDGDGVADRATVFADGFHHAADGLGSGVLARKGRVYYTCIPDLWLLQDTKGTGQADVKKSLATGFGVHVAFIGHDMHGLRMGPDGRLYFSIGDRGLNVTTREGRHLFVPDCGAVLRCEPDGANLEVVATGLRNPQELAFDQFGNLFTGDNNSDSGDAARWVYIVEGGDSGWRMGYQYGSHLGDRGPFNAEKIWHLPHSDQPAYLVPPIAHIANGPSGLTYYPGTGLDARYDNHFFLCDFRGSPGGSGVWSFTVKPKGASFELVDKEPFVWGMLATDCDFGPDGSFYVSDWVEGWGLTGKGRIYRFADPAHQASAAEVKKLLAEGFDQRSAPELAKLLAHPDMRVRQEAQFALVEKKEALAVLNEVATTTSNRLARLHAIWGLGQLGRRRQDVTAALRPLLRDPDAEVRAQIARVYGWLSEADGLDLLPLLEDRVPRVQLLAALSLGQPTVRLGRPTRLLAQFWQREWRALVDLLKDNADRDAYLRHAASLVMARFPVEDLAKVSKHESPAVRLAAVLALRRRGSVEVARFLDDPEPRIALEAARAIHDVLPPEEGWELAKRLGKANQSELFNLRALNAHFRLGRPENAAAIAAFAAKADVAEKLRIEAVEMLGAWAKPPRRDWVTGLTQNLPERSADVAATVLRTSLESIMKGPEKLRLEAAKVAGKLGIKEVTPVLLALLQDKSVSAPSRVEAVKALATLNDPGLDQALALALADGDPHVRIEGRRILAVRDVSRALTELERALEKGELCERQAAFGLLAELKSAEADSLILRWLDRLLDHALPAELELDLLEAAGKRAAPEIQRRLARHEEKRPKDDPLAKYRETLVGGDAEAGRKSFYYKSEVTCLKCHKIKGEGGEVGPDLAGIGSKQKRDYLLESIVLPNKQIAKGFETVVLTTSRGITHVGVLKAEDDKEIRLMTADAKLVVVAKKDIDERQTGKSAMPEDIITKLSKRELRDLLEFLASLK
jgi:quinoprotein glucose dehydrogenase